MHVPTPNINFMRRYYSLPFLVIAGLRTKQKMLNAVMGVSNVNVRGRGIPGNCSHLETSIRSLSIETPLSC